MRINIVSNLNENGRPETINTPNEIYALFLHKALVEDGVDVRLVRESQLLKETPPKTDHTIVISSANSYSIRDVDHIKKLRSFTTGKLTCYGNIDKMRGRSERHFDHCFTQIAPRLDHPEKYVYAGWGVDPSYSYPEQDEKAAFLDSKNMYRNMMRKTRITYQTYDNVLPKLNMKIYNPVAIYNRSRRISYLDYQAILRKCHYFLCTQFGDGGLSRLEAAACGALLVVPAKLYRKRTMKLFNHCLWRTEEELIEALNKNVDIKANRRRALEHTWDKVAQRILDVLSS